MPDIKIPVTYTADEKLFIKKKENDLSFTYNNWGDDDMKPLKKSIRDHYRYAQQGICCYCRNPVSLTSALNAHIEHIAPKSLYPDFIFIEKNLCVICADCNQEKKDQEMLGIVPDTIKKGSTRKRYPTASSAFKIVHPHIDEYYDHIVQVGPLYIDRTPKGHFTIGACVLNRFIRKFGWRKEVIDIPEVSGIMNNFLSASNPVDQQDHLKKLSEKLIISH